MRMRTDDHVVGADSVAEGVELLTVTDAGYGKRTEVREFSPQGRGGQGVRAHKLHADRGRVVSGFLASADDDVLLINDAGVLIRTSVGSISMQGRSATGVRVMNLDGESKVAAVARVLSSEDRSDDEAEIGPDGGGASAGDQSDDDSNGDGAAADAVDDPGSASDPDTTIED